MTELKKRISLPAGRLSGYVSYLEVAFFFSFLLIYIWLIMPLGNEVVNYSFTFFLVVFTVVSHLRHRTGWKELGFRFDNFLKALKILTPVIAITVLLLLGAGRLLNSLRLGKELIISVLTYPLWGLVQQYALQSFVNVRLSPVIENKYLLALVVASLFAVVHWPNGWLMAFTFVAGYFLSFVFSRQPNLPAVSIAHGILGAVLNHTLPANLLHGMVVGPGYY